MEDKNLGRWKFYEEFKNMDFGEQMEFAFSLENEEERDILIELANFYLSEKFKKVVEKGLF